eukprot:TRINITY_DN1775_c0_g1_i1.p1 TRINITY_DN1775_c0_g1~~TRINITY_DN1775_c0_g1_i1.p1  ORF type:complete len:214 (+),score=51.48 TRINITY_DN1775_c0_g1_i1:60-701(+)
MCIRDRVSTQSTWDKTAIKYFLKQDKQIYKEKMELQRKQIFTILRNHQRKQAQQYRHYKLQIGRNSKKSQEVATATKKIKKETKDNNKKIVDSLSFKTTDSFISEASSQNCEDLKLQNSYLDQENSYFSLEQTNPNYIENKSMSAEQINMNQLNRYIYEQYYIQQYYQQQINQLLYQNTQTSEDNYIYQPQQSSLNFEQTPKQILDVEDFLNF